MRPPVLSNSALRRLNEKRPMLEAYRVWPYCLQSPPQPENVQIHRDLITSSLLVFSAPALQRIRSGDQLTTPELVISA